MRTLSCKSRLNTIQLTPFLGNFQEKVNDSWNQNDVKDQKIFEFLPSIMNYLNVSILIQNIFPRDVNSVEQDNMRLDVWDFNPEESVNEKLNKINQVKDGRGLRKFIKETLHATAGKITHELLGSVEIPLKNLPASGVSGWWNLEKPETRKQKDRGEIHLSLTLSSDKDQHLTSQEHRHLLKILFAHELQRSNVSRQSL